MTRNVHQSLKFKSVMIKAEVINEAECSFNWQVYRINHGHIRLRRKKPILRLHNQAVYDESRRPSPVQTSTKGSASHFSYTKP